MPSANTTWVRSASDAPLRIASPSRVPSACARPDSAAAVDACARSTGESALNLTITRPVSSEPRVTTVAAWLRGAIVSTDAAHSAAKAIQALRIDNIFTWAPGDDAGDSTSGGMDSIVAVGTDRTLSRKLHVHSRLRVTRRSRTTLCRPVCAGDYRLNCCFRPQLLADEVGFEPTEGLHPRRISSPVHSTALPPIRGNRLREPVQKLETPRNSASLMQ